MVCLDQKVAKFIPKTMKRKKMTNKSSKMPEKANEGVEILSYPVPSCTYGFV